MKPGMIKAQALHQRRRAPAPAETAKRQALAKMPEGVEVGEQELGLVEAQLMYRLHCECGRAWFDLDLPQFVTCPSCGKLSLVWK